MIKLSSPGKMPCKSFSLQAVETCPGMFLPSGEVKDICKGCYATKRAYTWKDAKRVREDNFEETKKPTFVADLVSLILRQKKKYFRWFDSGDIYSNDFLDKVYTVCKLTPEIKHWVPTKSRDLFDQETWKKLESLPNVRVRFSSDSISGEYSKEHGSAVIKNAELVFEDIKPSKKLFPCPSSRQEGKCLNCRACWSKKIDVVVYKYH